MSSGDDGKKGPRGRVTQRGFGALEGAPDPELPPPPKSPAEAAPEVRAAVAPPKPADERVARSSDRPSVISSVEVEDVLEVGSPSLLTGPWRAVEIWTQNRVYGIDATMRCREVIDRASGDKAPRHATLGARLLGGQLRADDGRIVEVSHPLPRVGAAAVFSSGMGRRVRVSETSPVTRVVFRQRVVQMDGPAVSCRAVSWEDVTGGD